MAIFLSRKHASASATSSGDLHASLDRWCENLRQVRSVWETIDGLNAELTQWRRRVLPEQWREIVLACRQHPIIRYIHHDVFTAWSFNKPRGYPGDATLIDFIYQEAHSRRQLRHATPLGQAIYAYARQVAACRGVRLRRDLMAARIDEICFTRPAARILSVACGHLREAALSDAVAADRLETLIALDQDHDSLATVAAAYAGKRIDPRPVTVRQLLSDKFPDTGFDLVYAAGLYDYLDDRVAERLTRVLFDKLRPGGRLLIANFLDTAPDAGYMEAYMDWFLILRTREQFRRVLGGIGDGEAAVRELTDDSNTVVYLEIERRT